MKKAVLILLSIVAFSSSVAQTNEYVFKETEYGVYFLEGGKCTRLNSSTISGVKHGHAVGPFAAYAGTKTKSQIEGEEANYQLNSKRPTFYFNFTIKKDLNQEVSPNDFKLIRLDRSKGKREYVSGSSGVTGTDMSIGDKYLVNFKYERISNSVYKVILPKDLPSGEYCFLYVGSGHNSYSNKEAFDFGIK